MVSSKKELWQFVNAVKGVRLERINGRRAKLGLRDKQADEIDDGVGQFLQHPDLWEDEGVGFKVLAKVKEFFKKVVTNFGGDSINWDTASAWEWLKANWLKVAQIIFSIIGLIMVVGS